MTLFKRSKNSVSSLAKDETGSATVEFVLWIPVYITLLIFSVELGILTLRHTMLERGLDIAVRSVRLGTGTNPQHEDIKNMVCDNMVIAPACRTQLRLEMVPTDIRVLGALDDAPDCLDDPENVEPVKQWVAGAENQLMLLRACIRYDPMFPNALFGSALSTGSTGEGAIITSTAFAQEPT